MAVIYRNAKGEQITSQEFGLMLIEKEETFDGKMKAFFLMRGVNSMQKAFPAEHAELVSDLFQRKYLDEKIEVLAAKLENGKPGSVLYTKNGGKLAKLKSKREGLTSAIRLAKQIIFVASYNAFEKQAA